MKRKDYFDFSRCLLEQLSMPELLFLINHIGKETNLKKIHFAIGNALNVVDSRNRGFADALRDKISNKNVDFYKLIHLSIAVTNGDYDFN